MKHQRPYWLIALLVLVFVGQSLAAVAMPCRLMDATLSGMSHEQLGHSMAEMDHSKMDHSMMDMHHDMSHMDDNQSHSSDMNSTHDCCKTIGHCSSGSCSAPAMSYHLEFNLPADNLLIASRYHQHIPNSPISSLYRPPIFG